MADVPPPACGAEDERFRTFGLLLEAHTRLTRLLDADLQRTDGISLQTFEVLLRISRSPEGRLTMTDLAGEVALSTGGVTRLADRLTDDGLVERQACPSDRRRVHLALTPKGQDVLEAAMGHHSAALEEHLHARIDPADLPVLERVLDTLRQPADNDLPV